MELISGSQIAEEIKSALRVKNQEAGIIPQLEVVLVGENEESKVYVNLKEKAALSISARTSIRQLPASISKEGLLAVIAEANNDPAIDGIIIQLPLPQDLSPYQDEFLEAIKTEKDVDEICKAADIFAFSSFRDGLSVSLMEAMAAGLPVVCSNIRGNTDLIEDGKGGYLVEPNDVEGFAYNINRIANSTLLREKLSIENHSKIKQFDIDNVLLRMINVYNEI
jgi:glycosyltransferase involved in cell wall biosynthesis